MSHITMNELFNDVIDIFLPEIIEYIYEPTKYKLFMINNPNEITSRWYSNYDLKKHLSIPVEKLEDKKKYPYKQHINRISIDGSGKIGCKLKFIYIRKTIKLNNYLKKLSNINKIFLKTVKKILYYPTIYTIRLKENLNYKIFIKNLYDKYPNFYNEYFFCNYNVPNTYQHRNSKCLCYNTAKCDLCLLKGHLVEDYWWGNMYMCYNCEKDMDDGRAERYEDKCCHNDY